MSIFALQKMNDSRRITHQAPTGVVTGRFLLCKAPTQSPDSMQLQVDILSDQIPISSLPILTSILNERERVSSLSSHLEEDYDSSQLQSLLQQLRRVVPQHLLSTPFRDPHLQDDVHAEDREAVDLIENAIAYIRILRSMLGLDESSSLKNSSNSIATQHSHNNVSMSTSLESSLRVADANCQCDS